MDEPAANADLDVLRNHAKLVLDAVGVSRIVVVDDEYAEAEGGIEELLGFCGAVPPDQAVGLPHLENVDFYAENDVWGEQVRRVWAGLDEPQQRGLASAARALEETHSSQTSEGPGAGPTEAHREEAGNGDHVSDSEFGPATEDDTAATTLETVLAGIEGCPLIKLSLAGWTSEAEELLQDAQTAETLFLFDRNFEREAGGTPNEGLRLVEQVLAKGAGFCGLITHTVSLEEESTAWGTLAEEHGLARDRFVVISKQRLTGSSVDHYALLRMLRLAALSGRCATLKMAAWKVFEDATNEAKAAVEALSVLDFDQIVLSSSRREGVWEPDTLFRVFGILTRCEAEKRLRDNHAPDVPHAADEARAVSAVPDDLADALGVEPPSAAVLHIQQSEAYQTGEMLGNHCLPTELGDIFRTSSDALYILLAQPCDLMVRSNGKRSHDDRFGRTATLVRLVRKVKAGSPDGYSAEVQYFDADTGAPVYADFRDAHQVRLSVIDLCALKEGGEAVLDLDAPCPRGVIEPWRIRHQHLRDEFQKALGRYEQMKGKGVTDDLARLALPLASSTVSIPSSVDGQVIKYGLARVIRLRQPAAGALLTRFAHYCSREAFSHEFDRRFPLLPASDDDAAEEGTAEGAVA